MPAASRGSRSPSACSRSRSIVSLTTDFAGQAGQELLRLLELNKPLVAAGELWRLWTVVLVHAPLGEMPLHLLFNMYFLYLAGPFVERLYGRWTFLALYLLFAAGASLTSFAFTAPPDAPIAVGASGAIFGLFGLLVAAERIHRPVLDQQSRSFMGQLTGLVVINLLFGFLVPGIDNLAHIGGLVTGLVIGVLFAPTRVPTLRSLWVRPGPTPGTTVPAFGTAGQPRDPRRGSRADRGRVLRPVDGGRRRLGVARCSRCSTAGGRGSPRAACRWRTSRRTSPLVSCRSPGSRRRPMSLWPRSSPSRSPPASIW